MFFGRQLLGQARFGVVPNSRQINGRSSYTSQPFGPKCTQEKSASAASCSASVLTGKRDISSDEVVTGPQQSWQPGVHSKEGILLRKRAMMSRLVFIYCRLL